MTIRKPNIYAKTIKPFQLKYEINSEVKAMIQEIIHLNTTHHTSHLHREEEIISFNSTVWHWKGSESYELKHVRGAALNSIELRCYN